MADQHIMQIRIGLNEFTRERRFHRLSDVQVIIARARPTTLPTDSAGQSDEGSESTGLNPPLPHVPVQDLAISRMRSPHVVSLLGTAKSDAETIHVRPGRGSHRSASVFGGGRDLQVGQRL